MPERSVDIRQLRPFEQTSFEATDLASWRETAEESLKGKRLDQLSSDLGCGITTKPLYSEADESVEPGLPGAAPFVRGRLPIDGGTRPWGACAVFDHPNRDTVSEQIRHERQTGADELWVRVSAAARLGLDPASGTFEDAALDGTAVVSAADLEPLLMATGSEQTPIHIDAGGNGLAVAASLVAASSRQGLQAGRLAGSFNLDPLAALASDGELPYGLERSMRLLAPAAAWCDANAPRVRALAVSTLPYHMAAATPVHELAFALATGVEYLRALEAAGVQTSVACSQMLFRFAIGRDFFAEAAKLRAFRRLWSQVAAACGTGENHAMPPLHAVTSPRTLTVRDPWVNMLRTTGQTFSAVVGGADTITVLPFDGEIGPASDLGRRMALNTHTILREECHLDHVTDPAGGSWFVERLTTDMAETAWRLFQEIEGRGGLADELLHGRLQETLSGELSTAQAHVAHRRVAVTGVSTWPNLSEQPVRRPHPDASAIVETARSRMRQLERRSDLAHGLRRVERLASAERLEAEVFVAAIEAAEAGASLAELRQALQGDSQPTRSAQLPRERLAEPFEGLRDRSDEALAIRGRRPTVFLATLGPIPEHKARATFSKNLLEAGGVEVVEPGPLMTADEAVSRFKQSGAAWACLCSSDLRYADEAADVAAALRSAGATRVLLAGRPADRAAEWRAAGIDSYLYLGCNALEILSDLVDDKGGAA